MKKTVFVAMSGGVDSSVAAALMKKRGFDVVGVFMKPWSPPAPISNSKFLISNNSDCIWKQDREDALRVAAKLDIPLLTWDLSREYERQVIKYMIDGYKNGITPNPDVMCNKFIKFGMFLEKALALGADYIATGHYVRIKPRRGPASSHPHRAHYHSARRGSPSRVTPLGFSLHVAKDKNKDQSYFLYTLTQEQLKYCLFPIGDYKKDEIRKLAKRFGLPNWDKKDSQGVCFVGPLEVAEFLKKYIKPQRGPIVRKIDGRVLGEHDGVWYYTIGQRHIALSAGKPYYVVAKDVEKNILYVDDLEKSKTRALNKLSARPSTNDISALVQMTNDKSNPNVKIQIKDFNWTGEKEKLPLDCKIKTRYRQKDLDCTILKNGSDGALIEIKENNALVTPGQSAVFYKENEVLGGGVIV